MTNQSTYTSWMRRAGACALVAGILVFMANVSMARSQTAAQALLAGISHPLDFPSLEPPPPFPAKSAASTTTSTSSRHRYLGYVLVIGSLAVSHSAAVFMGSHFRRPAKNAPLHTDAVAVGPKVTEWTKAKPHKQTLALRPVVEANHVDFPTAAAPVKDRVDLGIVNAVSDHLVWISFQHSVEEWDGQKLAVECNGDPVGVMKVTRVSGSRLVADGAVGLLRTGDILSCRLKPYLNASP